MLNRNCQYHWFYPRRYEIKVKTLKTYLNIDVSLWQGSRLMRGVVYLPQIYVLVGERHRRRCIECHALTEFSESTTWSEKARKCKILEYTMWESSAVYVIMNTEESYSFYFSFAAFESSAWVANICGRNFNVQPELKKNVILINRLYKAKKENHFFSEYNHFSPLNII